MNKHLTSLIFAFITIYSCAPKSFFSEDINLEGKYVRKDAKWIELRFQDNNFVYYDSYKQVHMNPIICCDTISYGKWKTDSRGLIILNTPQKFENNFFMPMQVSEYQNYSQDSLYFIINNPIEKFYKTRGFYKKEE